MIASLSMLSFHIARCPLFHAAHALSTSPLLTPLQLASLHGRLLRLTTARYLRTMLKHKIHFITGNKNKLAEVEAILGGVVDLTNQSLHLLEIQGTIEEISRDKARRAAELVCGRPPAARVLPTSSPSCR